MAFEDVLWPQGQDNMSGLIGPIYWVPSEDVDLTTPPTLAADGVTVSGDIALAANKKFFTIYQTRGTAKLDNNMVGERDGKSFENMVEFKYPGDTASLISFMNQAKNTPMVVIVRDAQGQHRLLGLSLVGGAISKDLEAYFESVAGTTGAAASDAKGHTIGVKAEANHPALIYTGTIDLDDQA
jgi:hypothetical protein